MWNRPGFGSFGAVAFSYGGEAATAGAEAGSDMSDDSEDESEEDGDERVTVDAEVRPDLAVESFLYCSRLSC